MGLSKEELNQRREDKNVNYITERICNKNSGKPYVFISYKSDDWKQVLHDIVYKLVKNYGLNVYFDGDFNGHNPLWTEQFPENMESPNCKGVLAFIDDKYACSYATLMELLYSQAGCYEARPPYGHIKKEVVPVFLSKLTLILNEEDTGLGVGAFDNGEVNIHAEDEKKLFDDLFKKACELDILKNTIGPYKRVKKLPKELCATMVREVLSYIGANDNYYQEGINLEDIASSIKNAFGNDVFDDTGEPESEPCPDTESDEDPYLKYWKGFYQYTERIGLDPAMHASAPKGPKGTQWYAIRLGSAVFRIECSVTKKEIKTSFFVQEKDENKPEFEKLRQARGEIDRKLRELSEPEWNDKVVDASVRVKTPREDMSTEEEYAWFCNAAKTLYKVIWPYIGL